MKRIALCLLAIMPLAYRAPVGVAGSATPVHREAVTCVCDGQSAQGPYKAVAIAMNQMAHNAQFDMDAGSGTTDGPGDTGGCDRRDMNK